MLPTPQQLALRSQAPIHIFEKSEVPKDVAELYPGQAVITFETSEVPGEALFRLAAQLLKLVEQKSPNFVLPNTKATDVGGRHLPPRLANLEDKGSKVAGLLCRFTCPTADK